MSLCFSSLHRDEAISHSGIAPTPVGQDPCDPDRYLKLPS